MKLELNNFRCYRGKHSFEFEDEGMTLISGPSGAGKTTLLMAIFFVLTGNGPSKMITDGEESCTVTLQQHDTTICRTRRPNRVVVRYKEQLLEDDLAQAFINRHWGKHFDITSYVQQQYQKTFLFQSPTDKLEILERLCFGDQDFQPEELKKKCTACAKKINADHLIATGKLQTLQSILQQSEVTTPPAHMDAPTSEERRFLETELERTKILEAECRDIIVLERQFHEFIQCEKKITEQLKTFQDIPYSRDALAENQQRWYQIKDIPEPQPVWQKYTHDDTLEMMQDYQDAIKRFSELKEVESKVKEIEVFKQTFQNLEERKKSILELYEGIYDCPACLNTLALINDFLYLYEELDLKKCKIAPEQKRVMLKEINTEIEQCTREIHIREPFVTRYQELLVLINPEESLESLQSDYKWLINYYEQNREMASHNRQHAKLKTKLLNLVIPELTQEQSQVLYDQVNEIVGLELQRKNFKKYSEQLKEKLKNHEDGFTSRLSEIEAKRNQLEQALKVFDSRVHQYNLYQMQQKQYEKFLTHQQQYDFVAHTAKRLERQLYAVNELRQLILKTESEIISCRIQQISEKVNELIGQMFTDPITIELQMTKRTATQSEKVQVQLEVYYKNMKCDVAVLSGGEQARMNLAFILAFASVFHAPLLLLDECTSNLDAELTETVLEQVGNVGIPKVIMIAHQIVEGNFKQILHVQ